MRHGALNRQTRTFRAHAQGGFALVEVLVAAMVVALFMAGAFYCNGRALGMLRASKETISATRVLEERMEHLRHSNWVEVTDAASLVALYTPPAAAATGMTGLVETVNLTAWPAPSPAATPLQISRPTTTGLPTVVSDDPTLVDKPAVRVNVKVSWTGGPGARTRVRETSTIIANGGLGG